MTEQGSYQRSAPRPLSVYLGAAMGMVAADAGAEIVAAHKKSVEQMLYGIKKYQAHNFVRAVPALDVIWRAGTSSVQFCPAAGDAANAGSILLIPSMINGSEILDLLPGRSFARWLANYGFDVYLLDWGCPAQDSGLQTLDDGVLSRLTEAASVVQARTGTAVNALGYCMGGTLLMGAAAQRPDLFADIVLLSAPWDFHAGDPRMMVQVLAGTSSALGLLEQRSALPVDWIQNVFAHVNPGLAITKFSAFLEMQPDSDEEKVFIAVEDWLNSGQDLSAGVARSCILDWYAANKPAQGQWVDLARLSGHRVLVVVAGRDILVPPESSYAVTQHMESAEKLGPDCGHISLMAGRQAETTVWKPIADWLVSGG